LISDRTEKDRGGAELTGDGLGFRQIGSGSSDSGDAELLGACGGDDDVCLGVASKKVVAATWIRVRGHAERRLEVAVSAGFEERFQRRGRSCEVKMGCRERGEAGYLWRVRLGQGTRV
jgi:hypothetical protein